MPLKLNYRSVLTVFYNLLSSEYEAGIDPDVGDRYGQDEKETQLDSILATLRVCGRIKRVKALAWVKKKMLINRRILVEDSSIYRKVITEFRIDEK